MIKLMCIKDSASSILFNYYKGVIYYTDSYVPVKTLYRDSALFIWMDERRMIKLCYCDSQDFKLLSEYRLDKLKELGI